MKMKKAFLSSVAVICALIAFAGCALFGAKPKTFEKAGMSITLTTKFYEKEIVSQTAYYESQNMIVVALKENTVGTAASSWSLRTYAEQVAKQNKLTVDPYGREEKDYLWFDYEKTVDGKDFYYVATVHKTGSAFWLIQFGCLQSQKDKYADVMLGYADTITFGTTGNSAV